MTAPLREELERIADAAPVADVPAGTWARAQRARRRDRVADARRRGRRRGARSPGWSRWLPGRSAPPVASGAPERARRRCPAYVWSVPERLTMQRSDGSWSSDRVETDLAVGRGRGRLRDTAAGCRSWSARRTAPTTSSTCPGFLGGIAAGQRRASVGLALSPDGRQLAYAWAGPAPRSDAVPMPSGIRVVDLELGRRPHRSTWSAGAGVCVEHRSAGRPAARWLVWRGRVTRYWTATSWTAAGSATGRVAPGSPTSETVPDGRRASRSSAIDGRRHGHRCSTAGARPRWDGRRARAAPAAAAPAPVTARGRRPVGAAGSPCRQPAAEADARSRPWTSRPAGCRTHRLPRRPRTPTGAASRPLGWIDDGLLVALVTPVARGRRARARRPGRGDHAASAVADLDVPDRRRRMDPRGPRLRSASPST